MSDAADTGIKSDVLPKKARKSYKEPDPEEFDDQEDAEPDTAAGGGGDEEEEEDGEDLDDDEYVVEKIFSHYIAEDVRYPLRLRFRRVFS